MRKFMTVMVLFVGALVLPMAAKADSITATVTYANGTSNTLFSAPGKTITFSFSLPHTLTNFNDGFFQVFNVPVSVNFGGNSYSETAGVFLFTAADGGLFDFLFTRGGSVYEWDFGGASQVFDAHNQLVPGLYAVDPTSEFSDFQKNFGFGGFGTFTSGTVQVGAVPEPASLLLLGIGLLGIVPAARKRFGARKPAASNVQ